MQIIMMRLVELGYIVPLGIVSLGCLIAVTAIVGAYWHRVRNAEIAASLKHKMLDQGFSADDIKKVLEAGTNRYPPSS